MSKADRIRQLNDRFRTTFQGGLVVMTAGVDALPLDLKLQVIEAVRRFEKFDANSDPHGEHDFGSFELAACKFFWKIDAYDAELHFGSEDPSDEAKTTRVLTIMLAEEY